VQAEYNAVTCLAIYMLVMQFSQEGIDELRKYQKHKEMCHPEGDFVLSDGFEGVLGSSQEGLVKVFSLMIVMTS
jgi:serine/threonine-protein kinase ULK2